MFTVTTYLRDNTIVEEVETFTFPGGEVQVRLPLRPSDEDPVECVISAQMMRPEDAFTLALVKGAVEARYPGVDISLRMAYVPYARQDRVCVEGEAPAARVFCEFINSLNFRTVNIMDPHSDVVGAVLDRVVITDRNDVIPGTSFGEMMLHIEDAVLVSPDAGANKKTFELAYDLTVPMIRADKKRCVRTGDILETEVFGDVEGKVCFIADDIADGGATFMFLARALKEKGAAEVHLWVTHGIFSKGVEYLFADIDTIHTTNSWPQDEISGLHVEEIV
jgi:ribose-phosphate pyrophosphokinase